MLHAALVLIIAAGATASSDRSASDFFAGAPGTTWHYDGEGGPAMKVSVAGKNADGSLDVTEDDLNGVPPFHFSWRLSNAGWEEYDPQHGSKFMVILPAHFHAGSTWSWHYLSMSGETFDIHYDVVSMSDSVVLKSGKRVSHCVSVDEVIDGSSGKRRYWYAPHQGLVAVQMRVEGVIAWDRSLKKLETRAKK